MNDEMKNKSGKVKVMYVRSDDDSDKRTQNPRTGKGGGRPASSRADGTVAPPAMTEITAAMTANVMTVSVTIANAMMLSVTVDRHGVPFLARPVKRRPKKPITAVSAEKALSIRKCCVVSVRKRPVSTVRTPVRPCSRAARSVSFVHGLFRA